MLLLGLQPLWAPGYTGNQPCPSSFACSRDTRRIQAWQGGQEILLERAIAASEARLRELLPLQGGAAAVAQQQGLLVPNGAAGAQSVSPSPASYGSGYGGGAGSAGSGYGQNSGTSTPSYGSGANSPPASGYGASSPPTSGSSSSSSSTPSYGSSGSASGTPAYGSTNAASSTPPTGASSVPGTVTAYNQGQPYGSSQQSNASGIQSCCHFALLAAPAYFSHLSTQHHWLFCPPVVVMDHMFWACAGPSGRRC